MEIQRLERLENYNKASAPESSYYDLDNELEKDSPLARYESTIENPNSNQDRAQLRSQSPGLEVESVPMQAFLATQAEAMERLKIEEEQSLSAPTNESGNIASEGNTGNNFTIDDGSRLKQHVGPIQFNMGGIQVDAEDMINRIKERSATEENPRSPQNYPGTVQDAVTDGQEKPRPEVLASFFAGLIKKSGGSNPGTPPSKEKTKPR